MYEKKQPTIELMFYYHSLYSQFKTIWQMFETKCLEYLLEMQLNEKKLNERVAICGNDDFLNANKFRECLNLDDDVQDEHQLMEFLNLEDFLIKQNHLKNEILTAVVDDGVFNIEKLEIFWKNVDCFFKEKERRWVVLRMAFDKLLKILQNREKFAIKLDLIRQRNDELKHLLQNQLGKRNVL